MNLSSHTFYLLAAIILQQVTSASKPTSPTVFRSADMHFDYEYDSTLTDMATAAQDAMQSEKDNSSGLVKQAMACVSLPLTAVDSGDGLRMVMIMRLSGTCLGTEIAPTRLADLATSTLTQSLGKFGTPTVGSPTNYTVANHQAATLSGSVKSEKFSMTFTGTSSCLIQGKDVLCWEMVVNDCSKLPALMTSPITFDGQPPTALIPEKYAPVCKP